jgi:hypothetical protein
MMSLPLLSFRFIDSILTIWVASTAVITTNKKI